MSSAVRQPPSFPHDARASTGQGLTLRITTHDGAREVHAHGRLVAGAGAAHTMWAALARELGRDLVLDLSGVSAIDAAGVGRLLHTRERLGARGARLTITRASPRVRRVLDLLGVSPMFFARGRTRASDPAAARDAVPQAALCGCGC